MVCGDASVTSSSEISDKHIDFIKLITNSQTETYRTFPLAVGFQNYHKDRTVFCCSLLDNFKVWNTVLNNRYSNRAVRYILIQHPNYSNRTFIIKRNFIGICYGSIRTIPHTAFSIHY